MSNLSPTIIDNCKKASAWLFTASVLFYFALMPWLHLGLQKTALILFYVCFFLDYIVNKRYLNFKITFSSLFYASMIALYLWMLAHSLFEADNKYTGTLLEGRLSYLSIGIIGILGGTNDKLKIRHCAYIGIIMSLFCIITVINKMGWNEFLFSQDRFILFNHIRHITINAHMGFNLYILFSITLTYCLIKDYNSRKLSLFDKIMTYFCGISSLVLLWFVINSHGLIGIAFTCMLVIFCIIDSLKSKPKILASVIIAVSIISVAVIANRPSENYTKLVVDDPRSVIWELSIEKIKEHPVLGHGSSSAFVQMKNEFVSDEWHSRINDEFIDFCFANDGWWAAHSHNYFLQNWLELGIIGLILSLLIVTLPFFCLKRNKLFFPFCMILLFLAMQMMTDIADGAYTVKHFCFYYLIILGLQGSRQPILSKDEP